MTAGDPGRHGPGREPGSVLFLALLVPLVAGIVLVAPGAAGLFELERTRLLDGELWRLLTGHLAHYSSEHWLLDALAFLALALTCARRAPARTAATLALAALAIPLAVLAFLPEMQRYRGLSGLDSALFGLCLALELRTPGSRQALLAGALFAAKLAFELFTGRALFLDSLALGFTPVPLAHAFGASVGLALGLAPRLRRVTRPGAALPGGRARAQYPSASRTSRSSASSTSTLGSASAASRSCAARSAANRATTSACSAARSTSSRGSSTRW